jgi:MFS family permease
MPHVDPSPRAPTGGSPESVSEAAEIAADEGVVALDAGAPGRSVRDGFRALRYPGYRIYFAGMLLRGAAIWMLMVTVPWLATELGASPSELGVITALLFLPTLFIGALGGVLADRVERRSVLLAAQLAASALATGLFLVSAADAATLVIVGLAALVFGILTAIEIPVRQAYLTELVPREDVASAVSLHATAWNTTRLLGPVVAGLIIATAGVAATFLFAAAVALATAATVPWMDRHRQSGRHREGATSGILADLREGAAFAVREPVVRWPLILVAGLAIFGMGFFVTLAPLYVPEVLGLGAGAYGAFVGATGAGALVAALVVTAVARGDRRPWLVGGMLVIAALMAGLAIVGLTPVAFVLAFAFGAAQIALAQNALVSVQSATPDVLRGRVMGIWVMVFQGTSPFGSLLAGWLAEATGIRAAMLVAAAALAAIGLAAAYALRRVAWERRDAAYAHA